jgi:hypothetical protein
VRAVLLRAGARNVAPPGVRAGCRRGANPHINWWSEPRSN